MGLQWDTKKRPVTTYSEVLAHLSSRKKKKEKETKKKNFFSIQMRKKIFEMCKYL